MTLDDLERFVRRAAEAQAAVDELTKPPKPTCICGSVHLQSARYGHAHLAWCPARDGMDKIIQKTKPKEYKTGPRRKGRAKLAYQLLKLTQDVSRFAMKPEIPQADREWAGNLLFQLQQLRPYQRPD